MRPLSVFGRVLDRWTLARLVLAWLVLVGASAWWAPHGCVAAEGVVPPTQTIDLPDAGARVLGFKTQLQVASQTAAGYVPVEIAIQAVGALPADRRLIFRFETHPGGEMPPRNGLTVDVPIDLAQGTTTETFVRYLPKWSAGQALEVSVIEGGRVLEDYTAFVGQSAMVRGRRARRDLMSIERQLDWVSFGSVEGDSDEMTANLREILVAADDGVHLWAVTNSSTPWNGTAAGSNSNLTVIPRETLPTDWRAYQRFDAILLGVRDIERLQANQKALDAVRAWVLSGGTIIQYDADLPASTLENFNFRMTDATNSADAIEAIALQVLNELEVGERALKERNETLRQLLETHSSKTAASPNRSASGGQVLSPGRIEKMKEEFRTNHEKLEEYSELPRYSASKWPEYVWVRPIGAGHVIGMRKSDQYDYSSPMHWRIAAKTFGYRVSPMLRRGVDPLMGDRRFTRWLIPGVAEPPVYTFMGLLTAFVILVGPIAYRRTTKYGRSYLMFAIAPFLALFTTVAMFGYGIISDGFGTVLRARQLTWVDGKSGDAGERIRTTYFAGVRPGDGLRFPGDAEVIGYPEGTGDSWSELNNVTPNNIGRIVIREDSQRFDSSFLPSRQQRQFVVHVPRYNLGFLQLISTVDGKSPPTVQSSFDFTIHEAVIRDGLGNYWTVENLAGGQKRDCVPLSAEDSSKALGRIYNDHRPLSSVRGARTRVRNNSNEIYDLILDVSRAFDSSAAVTDGTFEFWLQHHLQTSNEIPREHFVATADVSNDVVAVKESELAASIRYVFGTLR